MGVIGSKSCDVLSLVSAVISGALKNPPLDTDCILLHIFFVQAAMCLMMLLVTLDRTFYRY